MIYKTILIFFLSLITINSYAQIEKEPINEMVESSYSGYYDIPRDKLATLITNIKEKDKFLLHTLVVEDEIDILSEEDANKYFFQKYKVKKVSPLIVFREKNVSYNSDLEITATNSNTILIKNFYDVFGKIPKEYNLYLVGKDLQYYPINMTPFEKERQLNFYTDYDADYNLGLVPAAKNIYVTNNSNIYPFRNNLNYYFKLSNSARAKVFLEDTKPRGINENSFYIYFSQTKFNLEITNADLKKDTFYFLNTPLDKLSYQINDKSLKIEVKNADNLVQTVLLKDYIMSERNIKFCETDKCTSRFITLEELLKTR
jgi:hypothetical protein